jgi:ATP/ADP translocase/HEAT repeat protein
MNRLLESIFGMRPEERSVALLMALYNYLLLITFYLLKPVRDSLFLAERGASELPFVFILTTAVIIPVAGFHTRAGRAYDLGRLIDSVSVLLVINIVALRWLITLDAAWVTYVLYAWVSIYGVLVTSQFWLFANAMFTPAQAKRVFALLSLGAILGAVTGGEITGLFIEQFGIHSHNLLWIAAALLAASIGLVKYIRHHNAAWLDRNGSEVEEDHQTFEELGLKTAFDALRGSHHLLIVVGVIALTVLTTTIVDFQFKTLAARAYPGEEALATFMGRFYGRVSLVALIVQFALAPYLLRIYGIGGALSFLPAMLAVGTLGMLFAPGLVAATLLRGSEQSLKHSIDRTGRELLFVPVDLERKKRTKVFIDLFVDQGTQGLGGVLLLFFTLGLGFSVYELSFVVLGLVGAWGTLTYRARHSYTHQFRKRLRDQEDYEPPGGDEKEQALPEELNRLIDALCSRGEQATRAALDELEEGEATVPVAALHYVLDHQSPEVRAQAIRVLRKRSVAGLSDAVAPYLLDLDPDVQLEAARYLYRHMEGSQHELLNRGLTYEDSRVRAATIGLIAREGGPSERALVTEDVLRELIDMEGKGARERRIQVARLLGVVEGPYRNELLRRLLRDDDPEVVREAIASAGKTRDRAFVFLLLDRLQQELFEAEARNALAEYGIRILGMLYDHLTDDEVDLRIRCRIPYILALQPRMETAQVLLLSLGGVPIPVRHAVVKALSRLQAQDQDFEFAASAIERALRVEATHYAALGQIVRLHRHASRPSSDRRAFDTLDTARLESLERMFRLLGLRYDQRDIYNAYLGITGDDPFLRSSAVEFVDNLLDWKNSRLILPLLDDPTGEQAAKLGPHVHDVHLRRWSEAVTYMLKADDPRLNVLGLMEMGQSIPETLRAMEAAVDEQKPVPSEVVG